MAQCKVWLDNYHAGQYYPGSQLQGKVVLNFSSETKCRAVKLRMFAQEHTEWMGSEEYTEPGSNERKTREVRLHGNNDIFSTDLILYGAQTGTTALSAGQHIYPFSFNLPKDIPATYNCEYGSITFKLVAVVDRPMAFDFTDELIFLVVSLKDLNQLGKPDLLQPTSYSDDKTVCCLCCAQGPITMDVSLPKRTLVPEETVNITVRLTNMSNTNIECLDFKLIQVITCTVKTPQIDRKSLTNYLINLSDVGLGAHGEHTYTFPVKLPSNCAIPNFSLCKIFEVEYTYVVTADLPGVHSNLVITMYPELGNIDIGQQAPIGGYQPPPVTTYPMSQPSIPGAFPGTQYPPSGPGYQPQGGGAPGYPQYPPQGAGTPGYPQPSYPQPSAAYPPAEGYAPGAYPSLSGYSAKAQEAAGYPSAPPNQGDQYPPSYNSVQHQ